MEISEDLDSCLSGDTPSAKALRNKIRKPLCLYTSKNELPLSCYTERVLVNTGSTISMGPSEQQSSADNQLLIKPQHLSLLSLTALKVAWGQSKWLKTSWESGHVSLKIVSQPRKWKLGIVGLILNSWRKWQKKTRTECYVKCENMKIRGNECSILTNQYSLITFLEFRDLQKYLHVEKENK